MKKKSDEAEGGEKRRGGRGERKDATKLSPNLTRKTEERRARERERNSRQTLYRQRSSSFIEVKC